MKKELLKKQGYDFAPHYHNIPNVGNIHYIDEGQGEVIVFVHGNPAWSFAYRKLINELSKKFRCIALDHIGFGLSDKPYHWPYLPEGHSKNFEHFMNSLGVSNVTLVVNDWGGPIGLSYAIHYPENVKRLVLFNTWMWSVKGVKYYENFSGFMGGPIGKFLIKYFNFFGRVVVKASIGNKNNFPKEVRQFYYQHLERPRDRKGCWTFPKQIVGSSEWLQYLWNNSNRIKNKPTLLLWGMKDIAFRKDVLEKWQNFFSHQTTVTCDDAGHFPQEEQGKKSAQAISTFIKQTL